MKKEVLIAIAIGFVLGLIITVGIWTANRTLKNPRPSPEGQIEQPVTSPTPTSSELPLTITSPEDNAIIDTEKIEISGKTAPDVTVLVLYEEGEKIIQADKEGEFSTEITLVGGGNEITVSAYDTEGNEDTQTLNLVFSTAEI
jgi:hypothetical protein